MIAGVKKENLQNIFDEFLFHLNMNFQAEGFTLELINRVLQEYHELAFAKTANRQVLGVMNDFAYGYEYYIESEGGLDRVRILEANRRTNRTPSSPLKYHFPIDMVWMLLTGEKAPRPLKI
ncbi:MAG: hypothetical protein HZB31_02925 [Nitrospirae bacterium]|nr:hypothetical protein [Nitrospirota bacterium]